MPKIESLRNYPVAGMDGYDTQELIVTPEAIVGNRSFAVVLESEIEAMMEDAEYTPLRMTQTLFPQLTLFKTENKEGKLVIHFQNESIEVNQSIEVEEPTRNFYSKQDSIANVQQLLIEKALPFRVARRSQSKRWAEDCGDDVASWLSKRIGQSVRLIKAVKHPEEKKHHFTWYNDLHAVTQASLEQLAQDSNQEVDELTFRYNAKLVDTEPFDEEKWQKIMLDSVEGLVTLCKRCKYIGIERATAIVGHYHQVLEEVSKKHDMNFGIYINLSTDDTITIRVGDQIRVIEEVA